MTNWEKFKEVFGIPSDNEVVPDDRLCEILDCGAMESCTECPFSDKGMDSQMFWDEEYETKTHHWMLKR